MSRPQASAVFAVLWTAWMLWWASPLNPADVLILVITGAIVGFVFFWMTGKLLDRAEGGEPQA